jgi:hypothetical protein
MSHGTSSRITTASAIRRFAFNIAPSTHLLCARIIASIIHCAQWNSGENRPCEGTKLQSSIIIKLLGCVFGHFLAKSRFRRTTVGVNDSNLRRKSVEARELGVGFTVGSPGEAVRLAPKQSCDSFLRVWRLSEFGRRMFHVSNAKEALPWNNAEIHRR